MRLSVHLVTWNSARYLPQFFNSLRNQTTQSFDLIIVDNASEDKTMDILQNEQVKGITIIRNPQNIGFARAHNQAIQLVQKRSVSGIAQYDAVVVINPDIILEPNTFEEIIKGVQQYVTVGSLGVTLYRAKPLDEEGLPNEEGSFNHLDSLGLNLKRNHAVYDILSGYIDRGDYISDQFVFGISGALCVYRWQAIKEIMDFDQMFFDESFFSYKEDVDMAWRLQLRGWKSVRLAQAKAWHVRSVSQTRTWKFWKIFRSRKQTSQRIRRWSYRNHLVVIIKNEFLQNIILTLPWILGYELVKFIIILFSEPLTLLGLWDIIKSLPKILKRRHDIMTSVRIKPIQIRKWYA